MVDRLTDVQVKAYKSIFRQYRNETREVEYRYLETMLNALGFDPSEMEMEAIYEDLDVYCNGSFSFPHFLNIMVNKFSKAEIDAKKKQKNEDEEVLDKEMKEAFKVFDADGNGFISQAELKHALIKMGEHLSDSDIEDMMHEADKDGDGQVSFPEFCNLMPLKELKELL